MHLHAGAGAAPADVGGVERRVAHRLGATGDDEIVVAVTDLEGGLDDGLQARTAAAVDVHAGHRDRQTGVEGDDATDGRGFAVAVAVAEDDVLNLFGRNTGALEQTLQCRDTEIDCGEGLEHSAVAADRGTDRLADDNFTHDDLSGREGGDGWTVT
ncbi:hypothetical protein Y013_15525 [Rhodococcus pyridinivorans SB3094]|uniref:Uncharacterized protein n=1 Tax=Rhodococcus pyridinivorans SB3094 TaxID=1435356 RepID=V9XN36_9NOCA|nr:hypothetical protein Y013_15525 [Rhodococcus pyridinivorans SB3094]